MAKTVVSITLSCLLLACFHLASTTGDGLSAKKSDLALGRAIYVATGLPGSWVKESASAPIGNDGTSSPFAYNNKKLCWWQIEFHLDTIMRHIHAQGKCVGVIHRSVYRYVTISPPAETAQSNLTLTLITSTKLLVQLDNNEPCLSST